MLKTFAYLAAGLSLTAAAVLGLAARKPSVFRVARSLRIRATPEQVFSLIDDLQAMNTWNPYALRDPAMHGSYTDPAAGPGATFTFDGRKSGTGSIAITHSEAPHRVAMRLLMRKPFACDNAVEFTLVPHGDETEVTWAMSGPATMMSKVMQLVMDMEKMCGRDFEQGLADLKRKAESA